MTHSVQSSPRWCASPWIAEMALASATASQKTASSIRRTTAVPNVSAHDHLFSISSRALFSASGENPSPSFRRFGTDTAGEQGSQQTSAHLIAIKEEWKE